MKGFLQSNPLNISIISYCDLFCVCVCVCCFWWECVICCISFSVVPNSLWPLGLQPTRLLYPWDFSRQGYWSGVPLPSPLECLPGSKSIEKTTKPILCFSRGIFPTQGSNPGLLYCRQILYQLSYKLYIKCLKLMHLSVSLHIFHKLFPFPLAPSYGNHYFTFWFLFLDSTYTWYHTAFVFFCLAYFT